GVAAAGGADRLLIHDRRIVRRGRGGGAAERARRAGRIGLLRGIEHVGAPARLRRRTGRRDRRRTRRRRGRRHRRRPAAAAHLLEAIFGVVLHALELHLQHLVVMLELLDGAGELAQRALDAVDARRILAAAAVGLRNARRGARRILPVRLLALLARVEQIVEEAALAILRGRRAADER